MRHANTLNELVPTFLFPLQLPDGPADSSFLVRKDAKKQLRLDYTIIDAIDTVGSVQLNFRWNKAGHLEKYRWSQKGVMQEQYDYSYVRGQQLTGLTVRDAKKRADTLSFAWNRAGLVSGENYSIHNEKQDTVLRMEKLYDGKKRIIVATSAAYGPLVHGTFTFEYDDQGRLARRCFLVRNGGAVFCTDTLIYSFADSLKTVLRTEHLIRIAGFSEWIKIDERKENAITHTILEYWLENGPTRNGEYDVPLRHFCTWQYNPDGSLAWRLTGNMDNAAGDDVWYSRYYYNEKGACDSIRTYETVYDGKLAENVYSRLITFACDPVTGLPVLRKEISYISFNQGRKKKWQRESASEIRYEWE